MRNLVLAVDADDVIWPFNEHYVAWHNVRYGTSFAYEHIYTFDTVEAVERHLPGIFSAHHFTNGFSADSDVAIKRTKLEVCQEIGAKGLVEDALGNALIVVGGGVPVFLPDRPWNQLANHQELEHPLITRFFSYESLPELVEGTLK